ncbi:hypothetical protein ABZY19_03515 [Streptomyces sp. NPDC006475]|uniref:Uncharacterized protein n=1 Tax=Streptomyces achmelvichensis TaxID=3134111 RepID=A0ACC6PT81_9ACTN|nr:hypothetical protein OG317_08725 [Streptomyces sp. NBC_01167]
MDKKERAVRERFDVAPLPDNGTESTPGRFNISLFLLGFLLEHIDEDQDRR